MDPRGKVRREAIEREHPQLIPYPGVKASPDLTGDPLVMIEA